MNIKDAILQLAQRADKNDDSTLVSTFVQVGAVMPLLLSKNNHILFGRRGTGKTHVLKYLKKAIEDSNEIALYIDMRLLGSSNSIYSNSNIPIEQRTLRLLSDVIKEIHDGILNYLVAHEACHEFLSEIGPLLRDLVSYANEERISGMSTIKTGITLSEEKSIGASCSITSYPNLGLLGKSGKRNQQAIEETHSGYSEPYVDFQSIYACLDRIMNKLAPRKLWVLVDEFSEVEPDLQVYLADLFKRVFSPNNKIFFKIAAIEHRSCFIYHTENGGYRGLEIGADVASCNLDNYLVFGNNEASACRFYRELLHGHVNSILNEGDRIKTSDELIGTLFTQENVFVELVDAAEGVPRDAFNILSTAITIDYDNKISIPTLRKAARQWYVQDKQKNVDAYKGAYGFLSWIIDVVINKRHAKAFLLKSGVQHELINYLYDARILHIIKQSISGRDIPGERYDVYSIDFGCYCDLINTAKQPKGLFSAVPEDREEEVFVDVPKDDYRSIRRAILNLEECPYL